MDIKRKKKEKGGFRTKKEAGQALTAAMNEYNNAGTVFEPTEITVADYLNQWFDLYCKTNLKYNTQVGYLRIIQGHLIPKFGVYRLKAITPAVLQEYAVELKMNGNSKSHLVGILSVFSAALNYAVEPMHYLQSNPMQYVKFPKVERKPRERIVLTLDEWCKIRDRFQNTRYYIPLMIGFYTGLRISETFGLTWDDIDFNSNLLTINKTSYSAKVDGKTQIIVDKPKTKKSNRVIPLPNQLVKLLKIIKKESNSKYVITTRNSGIVGNRSYQRTFKFILKKVNVPYRNFHSLRHTFATNAIELGMDVKTLAEILGHTNAMITLNRYSHSLLNYKIEMMNKLGKNLNLSIKNA